MEFEIQFFVTFSTILRLSRDFDKPVVTGGGNRSTRRKPLPNPQSLATFSHASVGITSMKRQSI